MNRNGNESSKEADTLSVCDSVICNGMLRRYFASLFFSPLLFAELVT